jgi:hypothetical protein
LGARSGAQLVVRYGKQLRTGGFVAFMRFLQQIFEGIHAGPPNWTWEYPI